MPLPICVAMLFGWILVGHAQDSAAASILTATPDPDSVGVLLNISDPPGTAATAAYYRIVRKTQPNDAGSAPTYAFITVLKPKSGSGTSGNFMATYYDPTILDYPNNKYTYTLLRVNQHGLEKPAGDPSETATVADPKIATPLLARFASTGGLFGDSTKWMKYPYNTGSWLPGPGDTVVQSDDTSLPGDHAPIEAQMLWVGRKVVDGTSQISAALTMSEWKTIAGLGVPLNAPLPDFHIGVGFSVAGRAKHSNFLGIEGSFNPDGSPSPATPSLVYYDDNVGKFVPLRDLTGIGWKPGDTIRLKLRIVHKATDPTATACYKVWTDGNSEPSSYDPIPTPWLWPAATGTLPLVSPALLGSVRALGLGKVGVTFSDVVFQTTPSPVNAKVSKTGPAIVLMPKQPSLMPPSMDESVNIPLMALNSTPVYQTRWGTALGFFKSEGPLPLEVERTPCPLIVPTASKPPKCLGNCVSSGYLGCASCMDSVGLPAMIQGPPTDPSSSEYVNDGIHQEGTFATPEGAMPAIPPGSIESTPLEGISNPTDIFHGYQSLPDGGQEAIPNPRSGSRSRVKRVGNTTGDGKVRPTAYGSEGPGGEIPLEHPRTGVEILPEPVERPTPPAPLHPLPTTAATRQQLRDYGAVATVPHPGQDEHDADAKMADSLWQAISIAIGPVDPKDGNPGKRLQLLNDFVTRVDAMAVSDEVKTVLHKKLEEMQKQSLQKVKVKPEEGTKKDDIREFNTIISKPSIPDPPPPSVPTAGSTSNNTDPQPRDPFSFTSRVSVLQLAPSRKGVEYDWESESSAYLPRTKPLFDELVDDEKLGRVWTYHFDLPARFATSKFAPQPYGQACAWEGEGTIIHEGMRLRVRQDGQYEVRFNATAPSIPVLVRLQLILYFEKGRTARTITLPPIRMEPNGSQTFPADLEGGVDPTSYIVVARGYSQVLKEAHVKPSDNMLLVKRIGTARVGNGVQYQTNP